MMSSKLSGREKVMLYVLVCFAVIILGVYLLIIPSFEQRETLLSDLETAQFTYTTTSNIKNSVDSTLENIAKRNEELTKLQSTFFENTNTEIVDRMLLSYITVHGISPDNVAFQAPRIDELAPVYDVNDFIKPQCERLDALVSFEADKAVFMAVLNDISNSGKFLVDSFAYSEDKTGLAKITINVVCVSPNIATFNMPTDPTTVDANVDAETDVEADANADAETDVDADAETNE